VVGEEAVAIGNALGYGQSVTAGVISALDREVTTEKGETGHFIQTDAAINPGNSGGALLNMRGELIGINSNKLGGTTVEGMGYAIPINVARPIIEQLIDRKELEELPEDQQSYFGVSGATVKSGLKTQTGVPIPVGVYVRSVVQGSPADLAGIQANDIITEFEGESVISVAELTKCLASYPSGTEVTITYKRLENNAFVTHEAKVVLEAKKN
jgi:serine protease Do